MSMAVGSRMASLRAATRDVHERTDAAMRRGDWLVSPVAYATFLNRTLRFHRLVEAAVAPVVAEIEGLEYEHRRRSPLVEADLAALAARGVLPDATDGPTRPPPPLLVDEPAAVLGCLYVIEGSTLGSKVLAQWIERRLGYDHAYGASSFAPYGTATQARWRSFGALVESLVAATPDDLRPMLAAAEATFAVHEAIVGTGAPVPPVVGAADEGGHGRAPQAGVDAPRI